MEWRNVVGFEGIYQVSELGDVRSLASGRGRKSHVAGAGYRMIQLWSEGEATTRTIHSLVADAFLGPRPEGLDICHSDCDKMNNDYRNLRYASRSENLRDNVRNGLNQQSRKTRCSNGHPYSGANVKYRDASKRSRQCKACSQERSVASRAGRDFDRAKADEVYARIESREKENT